MVNESTKIIPAVTLTGTMESWMDRTIKKMGGTSQLMQKLPESVNITCNRSCIAWSQKKIPTWKAIINWFSISHLWIALYICDGQGFIGFISLVICTYLLPIFIDSLPPATTHHFIKFPSSRYPTQAHQNTNLRLIQLSPYYLLVESSWRLRLNWSMLF